jgi:hypothetical protein
MIRTGDMIERMNHFRQKRGVEHKKSEWECSS